MKKVSIIIPCHNEQDNIPLLYDALHKLFQSHSNYEWEVVMIDDGSTDNTLCRIANAREKDDRIKYISLSRNFGKEAAMLAGFDAVSGDCAIIMDADLQHPVSIIPEMISLWEEGYEDIYAKRSDRGKEGWIRQRLTMTYYHFLQKMAKIDILPNVGDFRLLDRKCIIALRKLRETERYTKGLYCWIGFKKKEILYKQGDRKYGKSSFTLSKLFNLAIEGITSYTVFPLRVSTILGSIVSLFAFIYMTYVFFKTIIVGEPVQGFPTIIIIILFLGGLQLLVLGIIGEYLGRIFYETKHRPVYIISKSEGISM